MVFMAAFWELTPCCLVQCYQHFAWICSNNFSYTTVLYSEEGGRKLLRIFVNDLPQEIASQSRSIICWYSRSQDSILSQSNSVWILTIHSSKTHFILASQSNFRSSDKEFRIHINLHTFIGIKLQIIKYLKIKFYSHFIYLPPSVFIHP